jgi:CBS domain-containing membrane protein
MKSGSGAGSALPKLEACCSIIVMTTAKQVRDQMSAEVTTLRHNDALVIADDVMRLGRIRHLPVLDDDQRLVGIVSQRDLFRGALARALGYGTHAQQKLLGQLIVKEVMTSDPITISPDAPITEAAALMIKHKIGCLVVMAGEELVGLLTEGDFVAAVATADGG